MDKAVLLQSSSACDRFAAAEASVVVIALAAVGIGTLPIVMYTSSQRLFLVTV
jgi:hypothetical protein